MTPPHPKYRALRDLTTICLINTDYREVFDSSCDWLVKEVAPPSFARPTTPQNDALFSQHLSWCELLSPSRKLRIRIDSIDKSNGVAPETTRIWDFSYVIRNMSSYLKRIWNTWIKLMQGNHNFVSYGEHQLVLRVYVYVFFQEYNYRPVYIYSKYRRILTRPSIAIFSSDRKSVSTIKIKKHYLHSPYVNKLFVTLTYIQSNV